MLLTQNNRLITFAQCLILLGFTFVAAFLYLRGQRIPWIIFAVTPVILAGWHYFGRLSKPLRWVYVLFLFILIVAISLRIVVTMASILDTHLEGDFKHFWISARVAVEGKNFYDPANLRAVLAQLDPAEAPDWFLVRLVDTGFWYPPISIFIFLPLGLFDLQTAWTINYIFHIITFLVTLWAIQATFFPGTGVLGYLMLITLLLVFFPTGIILVASQTNFILIILLLLFWHHRDRPLAGIWLGLAIVVKPFAAVLLLFLLFRRYWRTVLNVILVLGVLSAFTILIYGMDTFSSYSPTAKLPPIVYTELENQGLLASILRLTHFHVQDGHSPIFHPLFLASVGVIALITIWLSYFLPRTKDHWIISLLLMMALLVYPTSLSHYGSFLILPLLWLWLERYRFPGGLIGALLFITVVFTVLAYQIGYYTFFGFLLCWLYVVTAELKQLIAPNLGSRVLASINHRSNSTPNQERLS